MQNISHSIPKRSFVSSFNGGFTTTHKSVYDDIFGGAKKNEVPTLAPRLEDYTEIFGGFHPSRSCSIPVLDIPVIEDELELHFDYAEVFGGSRGSDWAPYYEEVVRECTGGDEESDEIWSSSQTGSMSNEVDPSAGSDRSYMQSGGDAHQLERNMQFDTSFNKSNKNMKSTDADQIRESNVGSTPEYSCSHSEMSVTWSVDDEYSNPHATDDNHCNQFFDGRALVENRINHPSEKHGSWTCPPVRPFMTVCDVSLRTKPSRLPPPSRPPPPLVKRVEFGRSNSNHKIYKNHAFESGVDESDKLFLDVEVDVASSADDFDKKWIMEDVAKVEEKVKGEVGSSSSFKRDRVLRSDRNETRESISSVEGEIRSRKVREEFSEPLGRHNSNHVANNSARPVAWREESDFYEVVEKNISTDPFETAEEQFQNQREVYGNFKIIHSEAFEQNEDRRKSKSTLGAPTWGMKVNEHKMARDDCHWVDNQRRKKTQKMLGHRNDFEDKVTLKKLAGAYSFNRITPDSAEHPGNMGKLIGDVGYLTSKVVTECHVNEVEPELNVTSASSKKMELDKKFIHAVRMKEKSEKHEDKIVREEYHRRIEDVGRAEIRERLKETIEQEGAKKQPFGVYWKEDEDKVKESQALKEEVVVGDVHRHEVTPEVTSMKEKSRDASVRESNDLSVKKPESESGYDREIRKAKVNLDLRRDACAPELIVDAEKMNPFEIHGNGRKIKWDLENDVLIQGDLLKVFERTTSRRVVNNNNPVFVEKPRASFSHNEGVGLKPQFSFNANESEAGTECKFKRFGKNNDEVQDGETCIELNNAGERSSLPEQMLDSKTGGSSRVFKSVMQEKTIDKEIYMQDADEPKLKGAQFIIKEVDSSACLSVKESVANGRKWEDVSSKQSFQTNHNDMKQNLIMKDRKVGERIRMNIGLKHEQIIEEDEEKEKERENEHIRKGQEENEKEIEQIRKREEERERQRETEQMKREEKEMENELMRKQEEEKEREMEQMRKKEEEKEREMEIEHMRKHEEERERENEKMRKREEEKEREREVELMRKREEEKRVRELERMRKREEQKGREIEIERMRKQEEEREMENEKMRKGEEEKEREREVELMRKREEEKRVRELERMRKREEQKEREMEIERMRKQEEEREMENEKMRKREEEKEREREVELMRKREEEQRVRELERMRKREEQKGREMEIERMRKQEEEREMENEKMRKREEEKEREREVELMRKREEEKRVRELERMRKREEQKEREMEIERMRKQEEEREMERERENEQMRKREEERQREKENEQIRKREEEKEREREREKDMMAVDKAALEAHERSYVEARERAERANTEIRQRAIPVARETLGRTSVDARRKAERAAVERATAEARQRAVEQSMTETFAFNRVGKSVSDRFSASYKSGDTNNSSLPSDKQFKNTGISSGSGYAYGSAHVGAGGESPQRCKARLDRYRRTAERAANALAEKNRRDLLVQKEKEERNRVAETLDAEVRRWSSGKEGNLRALLSTLQYILGPGSGWQPVPLTEVITSTAVKKSYRKATLCVHPDKLQQRGASIQQKYLCEKVFDLLKEAWSKFNSEER